MKKLAVLFVVFMALYQTACGGDKGGGTDTGDKDVNIGTDEGQDAQKEVTTDTVVDDVKTDVKYDIPTDLPTDTPKDEGGKDEGTTETIGDDVKDVPPQDVPTSEEVTQMGLSCKEFWVCVGECPQGTQGEACVADCQAQMTSDAAMQVQALGGCLQNNGCYDKPTDDEFYACLEEFCLDEYFMCFSGNTYQTC
ncbi:MAG: hypothetical protein FJ088_15555, partial [Deltaproteobacteria bacterium]|nr:hypothetical protein [Deltaproteobacteria bacterium]